MKTDDEYDDDGDGDNDDDGHGDDADDDNDDDGHGDDADDGDDDDDDDDDRTGLRFKPWGAGLGFRSEVSSGREYRLEWGYRIQGSAPSFLRSLKKRGFNPSGYDLQAVSCLVN